MSFREKLCFAAGFALFGLIAAIALIGVARGPRAEVGSAITPTLEIAEGVIFDLPDGPLWYEHPGSYFPEKSQSLSLHRRGLNLQVTANGCPDPAREAEDDLSSERQYLFNNHGLTAAELADARFGGAIVDDHYHYAGYCLRDSRHDLVSAKLFLSIGPQCLIVGTQSIPGKECPMSEVVGFVRSLRIRD